MEMIILKCHFCNKEFSKKKNIYERDIRVKNKKHFYCSIECSYMQRRKNYDTSYICYKCGSRINKDNCTYGDKQSKICDNCKKKDRIKRVKEKRAKRAKFVYFFNSTKKDIFGN